MMNYFRLPLTLIAHSDRVGINLLRVAIAIVFLWIGALKFAPYEADSITPFVANSPFMSFFYEHPAEYRAHLTHEGELKPTERAWQAANNTYGFSKGLGTLELMIGVLTLVGLASRRLGFVGAALAFLTPFVTLSFLITTPEAWVPALGDAQHGFPYLSGGGRLVLKDVLLAGALLVMADSARALLEERPSAESSRRSSPAVAAALVLNARPASQIDSTLSVRSARSLEGRRPCHEQSPATR
jgi:reactive chlorine resistance protein C